MANSYTQGQNIRHSVTFTALDTGGYVDPTTVLFKTKDPDGTIATYTYGVDIGFIRDSAGHYHRDVTLGISGDWWYRFEASGTYIGAGENRIYIRRSQF